MMYFGPKPLITELRLNITHGLKLSFNITICSFKPFLILVSILDTIMAPCRVLNCSQTWTGHWVNSWWNLPWFKLQNEINKSKWKQHRADCFTLCCCSCSATISDQINTRVLSARAEISLTWTHKLSDLLRLTLSLPLDTGFVPISAPPQEPITH